MNAATPAGSAASSGASSIVTIPLNDPGEGLTEAEILEIKVAVGDRVEINAAVVEVETAKSAVELSTHVAGTVVAILVKVGDEVPVGAGLIQVDTAGGAAPAAAPQPGDEAQPAAAQRSSAQSNSAQSNSVQSNSAQPEADPSAEELAAQSTSASSAASAAATEEPKNLVGYGAQAAPQRRRRRLAEPAQSDDGQQVPIGRILAKPPVRKLAR
ncbi:MAG: biotin/lipoyl-containing protein, partial [Brachybacterium sp.]